MYVRNIYYWITDYIFSDIMSQPLYTFKPKEKVGVIYDMLKNETFCGYPVIEDDPTVCSNSFISAHV